MFEEFESRPWRHEGVTRLLKVSPAALSASSWLCAYSLMVRLATQCPIHASITATGTPSRSIRVAAVWRPGLAALTEYVRDGDTVVVWKLDRLGRNTLHILETVRELTSRGVTLVLVTDGIDSSTAAGRMMIGALGSLAEYERELTKERTALQRANSRANGTRFGRPRKV